MNFWNLITVRSSTEAVFLWKMVSVKLLRERRSFSSKSEIPARVMTASVVQQQGSEESRGLKR